MFGEEISAVAQTKFLAAEALHRVGSLIFVARGNCSANGLRKRDYVTGEMWKNKPLFRDLCQWWLWGRFHSVFTLAT